MTEYETKKMRMRLAHVPKFPGSDHQVSKQGHYPFINSFTKRRVNVDDFKHEVDEIRDSIGYHDPHAVFGHMWYQEK